VDGNSRLVAGTTAGTTSGSCRLLLVGLIVLLIAFPFLEDIASPLVLVIPLASVFVIGVVVTEPQRRQVRRAVVLVTIQIGLTVLSLAQNREQIFYTVAVTLALAATLLLMLFSTWCVLRYVLRAQAITRDQIYAGICMYIMLGFAFGAVFYLIYVLEPASFIAVNGPPGVAPDLMYFSFVTLATLGYGDIVPNTHPARSLAVLEALIGMVYIAVFMARLVSLRAMNDEQQ